MSAETFCVASASAFFLAGLLAGVWKYACIYASPQALAPRYVDVTHRASLMYAFASLLLAELCQRSAWSNAVNLGASVLVVAFFALAVGGYLVHGALRDTDNQLRRPHRLGARTIPGWAMATFMAVLAAAELGGVLALVSGFLAAGSG